jgi:molybdopterin/thiamine biosynthesis adenylyltransferase
LEVPAIKVFDAPGFPQGHPAESGLFVRQESLPGHDQRALECARVMVVGAGGLGSWAALMLVRSGVRNLTIIDPDRFDRTNAHRQLMFAADIGESKALAVARNLIGHAPAGATITAIPDHFEDARAKMLLPSDLLLVLVDNNRARLAAVHYAREQRIPAVFALLSASDAARAHCFLQGASPDAPCLFCALPNLEPDAAAPCAAGVITSCMTAASISVFLAHRALMGWPEPTDAFNWRSLDLLGREIDRSGNVAKSASCRVCGATS